MATPSTKALVAHVLRRTTFGPFPGQVDSWAKKGVAATITHVLNAAPIAITDAKVNELKDPQDYNAPVRWWIEQMAKSSAGVHEKMVFFWHGHLTSSADKVNWLGMIKQHKLLRTRALGNFATLLQEITIDAGMLWYLDGADSAYRLDPDDPSTPNENYSRELMELFALGRGNYKQRDVENGAIGLSGWSVDYQTGKASFDALNNDLIRYDLPGKPYLGKTVSRNRQVVSAVLSHPACAPWVAGRVWRYLVGVDPSAAKRAALAKLFRAHGYDIKPLVSAVLHDPAFLKNCLNRPKMPTELVTSAMAAAGISLAKPYENFRADMLYNLGQVPFYPPNVSGWPWGNRWLAPGIALGRANLVTSILRASDEGDAPAIKLIADSSNSIAAALARCSIHEVSPKTRQALTNVANALPGNSNATQRARVLLATALASPEFALA